MKNKKLAEPLWEKLRDVFNAFAEKAVDDFPQLKDRFVLYAVPTSSFHGSPPPDLTEQAKYDIAGYALMYKMKSPDVRAFAVRAKGGLQLIGYISDSVDNLKTVRDELEHELAHAVAPDGQNDKARNGPENMADAFSLMRRLQRGEDTAPAVAGMIWGRNLELALLGERDQYTAPGVAAVAALSRRHDLSKLDPAATANLAYRAAREYALPEKDLARIAKIFRPVQKAHAAGTKESFEDAMKQLALVMFRDHGDLTERVYDIGREVLLPLIRHETATVAAWGITRNLGDYKLSGDFWQDVSHMIAAHDAQRPPADPLETEMRDMRVLGHFDREQDGLIDPVSYTHPAHLQRLQKAGEIYLNLRRLQTKGEEPAPLIARFLPKNIRQLKPGHTAAIARQLSERLSLARAAGLRQG